MSETQGVGEDGNGAGASDGTSLENYKGSGRS